MKIGFCGALAILFIALKLCGVIAWSWLWVLSPLWIPVAIVMAIPVLTLLFCGVMVMGALTVGYIMALCGWKSKPRPTVGGKTIYAQLLKNRARK
jgi:fatty acid desaturase